MSMLRLLAASLLASACIFPAAAQSYPNALPLTATITTQPLTMNAPAAPSTNFFNTAKPGSLHFDAPKGNNTLVMPAVSFQPLGGKMSPQEFAKLKSRAALLAHTNEPCAKLRSYNFTARDLKSANPHPSSETDCTPASAGHLKTIPATVDTK